MSKKVISVIFIILVILAGVYYFTNDKVEDGVVEEVRQDNIIELGNEDIKDEDIIIEVDRVAEEEAEIDAMIDELEELQF